MKKAKTRSRAVVALCLSAVLFLATAWIAFDRLVGWEVLFRREGTAVTVPDLRGKLFRDGEMADPSLYEVSVTYVYDPHVPMRVVLSQTPGPGVGRRVIPDERRCPLMLVVSAGKRTLTVPDVEGMEASDAAIILREQGFFVGEDELCDGVVLATRPKAGSTVTYGSTVHLRALDPTGGETVACPDLVGLSRAEAERTLEGAGLCVGSVTEIPTRDVWGIRTGGDVVVAQDRLAGAYLPPRTKVSFEVTGGV